MKNCIDELKKYFDGKIKNILNKNLDTLENKILNSLFLVLLIIFFVVLFLYLSPIIIDAKQWKDGKLQDLRFLDLKYTLTTLGAIFAFWYSYKKYERDKELELVNNINPFKLQKNKEIILDWYIKKQLFDKGYISEYLYKEIESIYIENISNNIIYEDDDSSSLIIGQSKYFTEKLLKSFNTTLEIFKAFEELGDDCNSERKKIEHSIGYLSNFLPSNPTPLCSQK